MKFLLLILFPFALAAQPARMAALLWEYPSKPMTTSSNFAAVYFWVDKTENFTNWHTMAIVLPDETNSMAFYRVGVDWRTNAPSWMTNFQFLELPPAPPKAKALTAGIKTGKLPTVKLPPKTYRAVTPPMPPQ